MTSPVYFPVSKSMLLTCFASFVEDLAFAQHASSAIQKAETIIATTQAAIILFISIYNSPL
ncbi:hypothetical protein FACS1894122_00490 [Alphaproteobacteria bacterium]|nr:hypothetical protein FACS1894122_00490 [Alphaproteobacteria bacterium]